METEQQNNETEMTGRGSDGRFRPGCSGNPNGQPRHRSHLWAHFCRFMEMTKAERDKIDRDSLTASQESALKLVERAIEGRTCGFLRLMKYAVDRDEGRAVEHMTLDTGTDLSDAECDELRKLIQEAHGNAVDAD